MDVVRRKLVFTGILAAALLGADAHPGAQTISEFVTLRGNRFKLNGADFYPKVLNYKVDLVQPAGGGRYLAPEFTYEWKYPPTPALALTAIRAELASIRSKGFNTIRLIGMGVGFDCSQTVIDDPQTNKSHCVAWNSPLRYEVRTPNSAGVSISSVPLTAPYTEYLGYVSQFLHAARDENVKVIWLTEYKGVDWPANRAAYTDFIAGAAKALADEPALMAYDFFNEPGYSSTGQYAKKEICLLVSGWTDAVRSNDLLHLTTIGLVAPNEVMGYDPGILKLDFASFHPYPNYVHGEMLVSDVDPLASGVDRVKSDVYWESRYSRIPWIVGETGFTAKSVAEVGADCTNCDGSVNDQKSYADQTVKYVRDCGGSGYSWWSYRDVHYDPVGPYYPGNFFGLRDWDAGAAWKPAAGEFADAAFDPWTNTNTCAQPANYFNYYNASGFHISGTVHDNATSQPVAGAVIYGWSTGWSQRSATYTDASGHYDLFTAFPVAIVQAGAPSSNVAYSYPVNNQGSVGDLPLHRITPAADIAVNGVTLTAGTVTNYQAANSILSGTSTLQGTGVSGATATMRATNIVKLQSGFTVQKGAVFLAQNGPAYPDCALVP
jgi:hypothetical protein